MGLAKHSIALAQPKGGGRAFQNQDLPCSKAFRVCLCRAHFSGSGMPTIRRLVLFVWCNSEVLEEPQTAYEVPISSVVFLIYPLVNADPWKRKPSSSTTLYKHTLRKKKKALIFTGFGGLGTHPWQRAKLERHKLATMCSNLRFVDVIKGWFACFLRSARKFSESITKSPSWGSFKEYKSIKNHYPILFILLFILF